MTRPVPSDDRRPARCLAVFGTASDVGKSVVTTALCRLLRETARVAPFKVQNMSNNSCVTREGGEMGRAQYVQALAAGVVPHVDMNPILLKPSADCESQLVLLGKPHSTRHAARFFEARDQLFSVACAALERLRARHDLVIIEGAGSCAEVNLRSREIVNFPIAHRCDAPVILVADIDRGGVFAQLVGTLEVMPEQDRARVAGLVVNRFRGDRRLFDDGVRYIEQRTGLPVLGVVPFASDLRVDSEDSLSLEARIDPPPSLDAAAALRVAVIYLPHISNATDFDALEADSRIAVHFCHRPRDLSSYGLAILPGSKAVRSDLAWLRNAGWTEALVSYRRQQGRLLGLCGGYQMLGRVVRDPLGLEGTAGESPGLGLLDVETELRADKTLRWTRGTWSALGVEVEGYEIHQGVTHSREAPLIVDARSSSPGSESVGTSSEVEGALSRDGLVLGSYLHGVFDAPGVLGALVRWASPERADAAGDAQAGRGSYFDRLAAHFQRHLDLEALRALALGGPRP